MSNYLIKLTPIGKFFFGGDMTFSVGAKERPKNWNSRTEEEKARIRKQIDDNTRYSSYIIKSEKFPQQTSLLGMLRFLLLRYYKDHLLFDISGNKIKEGMSGEVEKVIGKSSFPALDEPELENKYGLIKELSPCFLIKGDTIITLLPKDFGLETIDLSVGILLSYNDNTINLSKIVSRKKDNGDEIKYSAKDGLSARYGFTTKDDKGEDIVKTYNEEEIFIEDQRIGISRNIATGKTEENALYKQINYRLADDFCFAFYTNIDIDDITPYNNQIVLLGADSSQFVIQIVPLEGEDVNAEDLPKISLPPSNVDVNNGFCKIVLTSPTIIDKEIAKMADFAITETIPFKFMKTRVDQKEEYHRLSGIKHSNKVELFQTGSVFYFRNDANVSKFKEEIENHKEFHQIGYNHFQVINLSTNK